MKVLPALPNLRDFANSPMIISLRLSAFFRHQAPLLVFDSFSKPLDSHNMGAIDSRITPTTSAEKPAAEWQRLQMTLVD